MKTKGGAPKSSKRRRQKNCSGNDAAQTTTTKKAKGKGGADTDTADPFVSSEHSGESDGEESSESEGAQ